MTSYNVVIVYTYNHSVLCHYAVLLKMVAKMLCVQLFLKLNFRSYHCYKKNFWIYWPDLGNLLVYSHASTSVIILCMIRYLDSRGQGYVRKKDFRSLLEDTLGCIISTQEFDKLVEKIGLWEDMWVPYPKFLVMFENVNIHKSSEMANPDDLKVDDTEVDKVLFKISHYAINDIL